MTSCQECKNHKKCTVISFQIFLLSTNVISILTNICLVFMFSHTFKNKTYYKSNRRVTLTQVKCLDLKKVGNVYCVVHIKVFSMPRTLIYLQRSKYNCPSKGLSILVLCRYVKLYIRFHQLGNTIIVRDAFCGCFSRNFYET